MAAFVPSLRELSLRAVVPQRPYDGKLVFWIDIFLVLCLAIFTLPRLFYGLGRLRTRCDWGKGLFVCTYFAR